LRPFPDQVRDRPFKAPQARSRASSTHYGAATSPQQSSLLGCGPRRAVLLLRRRDPGPSPAHPVP
jgi:hypothetical protein